MVLLKKKRKKNAYANTLKKAQTELTNTFWKEHSNPNKEN